MIPATADHLGIRRKIKPNVIGTVTGILNSVKNATMMLKMPHLLLTKIDREDCHQNADTDRRDAPDLQKLVVTRRGRNSPWYMSRAKIDDTIL